MNKSTNLEDIFDAMEEIYLLSEKRKKDKEILILDKDLELSKNSSVYKEKHIPIETEELIKQAEKQLNLIKEK